MKRTNNFYQAVRRIDKISSSKFNNKAYQKLISFFEENLAFEEYFFKGLKNIDWFVPFYNDKFFTPDSIPAPEQIKDYNLFPYWHACNYLKIVAKEIGNNVNQELTEPLLNIINVVTNKLPEESNNNNLGWIFLNVLNNLPNKNVTLEILNCIPVWFNRTQKFTPLDADLCEKFLPKFLGDNTTQSDISKAEKIIENIFSFSTEHVETYPFRSNIFHSKIDLYWLEDALFNKKLAERIGQKCSLKPIYHIADKIKEISEIQKQNNSLYLWHKSLTENEDFYPTSTEERYLNILNKIIKVKVESNSLEAEEVLNTFIGPSYPQKIFKRICFFIIYENWNKNKNYFWKLIFHDFTYNYLHDHNFVEVDKLIEKFHNDFTLDEKLKLKEIILDIPEDFNKDIDRERYLYYKFSLFRGDPLFQSEIEKYEQNRVEDDDTSYFNEDEPFDLDFKLSDEFSKPVGELVLFLKKYRTTFSKITDRISPENISGFLSRKVSETPVDFILYLDEFLEFEYIYISGLLIGFKDAWNLNKQFDWESLLNFIFKYIKQEKFNSINVEDQSENNEKWKYKKEWVISAIGELIQSGTRDENIFFGEQNIPYAKNIIFELIANFNSQKNIEQPHNYVDHPLNSAEGKLITVLIYLAHKDIRSEKKSNVTANTKWKNEYKKAYDKLLSKPIIDAYILLGFYLKQFAYLDNGWTKKKIKYVESLDSESQLWIGFMSGYLFKLDFSDQLFNWMIKNYKKWFDKGYSIDEHIAIAFLYDLKGYKNLFLYFIEKANENNIAKFTHFLWTQWHYIYHTNKQSKLIKLWKILFKFYVEKKEKSKEKFISSLLRFATFMEMLNLKNRKLLLETVKYIQPGVSGTNLIEELLRLIGKDKNIDSAMNAGKIFLEMLEKITPTYKEENIIEIVKHIYSFKDKRTLKIANQICNIYGLRGFYFLKDLYFENNK